MKHLGIPTNQHEAIARQRKAYHLAFTAGHMGITAERFATLPQVDPDLLAKVVEAANIREPSDLTIKMALQLLIDKRVEIMTGDPFDGFPGGQ